jgi:flagellar protein FlgJ
MANTVNSNLTNGLSGLSSMDGQLAFDPKALGNLKASAKQNTPEGIKQAAKQFEALFMNMLLKSMREATPKDGMLDSDQTKTYTSMLDQQLSQNLSQRGIGLGDLLAKQLLKAQGITPESLSNPTGSNSISGTFPSNNITNKVVDKFNQIKSSAEAYAVNATSSIKDSATQFITRMSSHAQEVSKLTGLPANFMIGQAALETGWGKNEIKMPDGSPSKNLFGIKATVDWKGKVASTVTTEFINGTKQTLVEKFRAYDSYAESFKDFANLIKSNPRYQNVVANVHDVNKYTQALQQSGYATDPQYANKLAGTIRKEQGSI